MTKQECDRASAKLIGWQFGGMNWTADTLVAAAEVADWQMDDWPVPENLQWLGRKEADSTKRLNIAAEALQSAWNKSISIFVRQAFLFAVLKALASRRLVQQLRTAIRKQFTIDVMAAQDVISSIDVWLQHPTGIQLP